MQMKSLDPESDEEDQEAEENLETLKAHLKECQRLGKYVEAQMTQNRITELKERLVTTKIDKLKTSQAKEMKIYQDTHEKEHANLTDTWQKKLADFEARSQDDEAALLAKQQKELDDCRAEAEGKVPEKPHATQEIVSLKKREEMLAKQGL